MSIQLDYAVPSAALADYVTLFYWFRADVPAFEDVERADHAQIRFRLTPGGAEYRFADGKVQQADDAHVVGPTTGAFHVRALGPVEVFGAGITPAGWAALIGADASAAINRILNVQELFGTRAPRTIERLRAASDLEAKKAVCEDILLGVLSKGQPQTLEFVRKVDAWLSEGSSPQIDTLVMATGLSRRQVERKCRALYGAPPKLLARKYRALRAAVALAAGQVSLDEAIGRGFYDQSHMIREIKQFTGMTPRQMRDEPGALAQLTIAHRYALAGQVHPLISGT
jgi:AraC-like DNA-binding protein